MRYWISFTILLIIFVSCEQEPGSRTAIKLTLENWKKLQIENEDYYSEEECEHFTELYSTSSLSIGFPDSIKITYSFLNDDTIEDALVTYFPKQCDGGNMTAWIQEKVLILSKADSFIVDDTSLFESIQPNVYGTPIIDSLINKKFYGRYVRHLKFDGFCCPSIEVPIILTFPELTTHRNKSLIIPTFYDTSILSQYLDFANYKPEKVEYGYDVSFIGDSTDCHLEAILYFDTTTMQKFLEFDKNADYESPNYNREWFKFSWLSPEIIEELKLGNSKYHGHPDFFFKTEDRGKLWYLKNKILIRVDNPQFISD